MFSVPSLTTSPTHPDMPPFPPLSTFSLLPEIYLLLSRIQLYQQQQQASLSLSSTSTQDAAPPPASNLLGLTPLDAAKELAGVVYILRQSVGRAKDAVLGLPGVEGEGGLEAQHQQIGELEELVRRLRERRGVLGAIAAAGGGAGGGGDKEGGVEGVMKG
jgi:hypothetical protein